MNEETLDWTKTNGLIPAIVQDADNLRVLMLGYMDQAALDKTRQTGKVTFFSRSKQRLWTKGEAKTTATTTHYWSWPAPTAPPVTCCAQAASPTRPRISLPNYHN